MDCKRFNQILRQVRQGDVGAIEPIYKEYFNVMYLAANGVLKNKQDAEDVAAQTFLEFVENVKSREDLVVDYPSGYLQRMAINRAINISKHKSRVTAYENLESVAAKDECDNVLDRGDIAAAIFELPEPECEIAKRFYFDSERIKTIASALNMPEGTVKWHISKIKDKLFDKLK